MASMARSLSIGSLWRCGQGSRLSGYGCQLPQEKTTIERKRAAANVASKDAAAAGTAVTCAAGAAGGLCCCLPAKSRRRGKQRRRGFNAVAASGQESKSTRLTVGRLLKLLLPDAHLLGTAFVFLVLAATCQALMPHFLSQTLGAIIDGQAAGNLRYVSFRRPLLSLLGAAMAGAFTASVRGACFIVLGARVSKRLRQRLFDSLVAQDIGFFDKTKGGEITSRLTQDCQRVADQVSYNVNIFSRTIVQLLVTLCFMLYYSRLLTAMSFATVPAIVLLSKTYGNFMQRLSEKTQQKLADANAAAQEALASMTTVRSFAGEEHERRRFGCRLQEYNALESRRAKFYVAYLTTTTALPQLGNCLIFCLIGYLCMHGMPAPSLLAFVFYLNSLNDGFGSVADVYTSIVQALGSSKRVFELIDRRPAGVIRVDSQQAELLEEGAGSMELAGVHFTYPARPGQPVLRGLNLVCPPGKVTALVGPSGGGKSTCIGLLKRLYEQDEGQVMLDGREVSSYSHKQFHEYVSIVGQEPELFACNVRENILYGLPATHPARQSSGESPGEEVLRAAKLANAHDFICKMPQGYATEVGGRGVQLSGGQKQRISIARALVRRPKVLLLDEATSALDAESEVLVQNAIDGLIAQHDMTVVVVAHRLSTVRRADKICVVSGGVVAEEGTHDELLSRPGGRYRQLVERQLGSVASGEDRLLEAVAAP
eukprot:TRINITY_DN13212_c0_g1_i1.p1 TRINITY_DN13212_c0_g1~~TRINITY_DN13212_c0_g1_i1.p1  ORF type:complete len:710 (+),score=143.10 TRINITY_DN13212_c0_g1_i1:30-2159(+)